MQKQNQSTKFFKILGEEFKLTVPLNYTHGNQFSIFKKESYRQVFSMPDRLTDENFVRASRLVPGRAYKVRIFSMPSGRVPSKQCLMFLEAQKAILVGAQGLSLLWQHKRERFPRGRWVVSFDETNDKVPQIYWRTIEEVGYDPEYLNLSSSDDVWDFGLASFSRDWRGDNCCLLCICVL